MRRLDLSIVINSNDFVHVESPCSGITINAMPFHAMLMRRYHHRNKQTPPPELAQFPHRLIV